MAIKFSQFVVQTNASALSHIVGYNGADNIQITPADFINSFVPGGPFLPLSGGTMTGNLRINDAVRFQAGSSGDFNIRHNGTDSFIENETGDLNIVQNADDSDIIFKSDNGSGGAATYMYLDGSITETRFSKHTRHSDNIIAKFGDGNDLNILHDSNHSYIKNYTGDLYIENFSDDKDIIFKSDNGSGGVTEYLTIDAASQAVTFGKRAYLPDNVKALFGNSSDLQIYHDGSNSYIDETGTGSLYIKSAGAIRLQSDTGENMIYAVNDSAVNLYFNNVNRVQTTSTGANVSGDLTVTGTITGSGGSYLPLAGGTMTGNVLLEDNVKLSIGTSDDFNMFCNGTDTTLQNITGDLNILNKANDKDINLQSDNGSGGVATYIKLDGSQTLINVSATNGMQFNDNVRIKIGSGTGGDMRIYHDGSNNYIQGVTGDMYIQNGADDKDIIFRSDDGSGGQTEYFKLDGTQQVNFFSKNAKFNDNVRVLIGGGNDLQIYHDGSNSHMVNLTGNLRIRQFADDSDITFESDDGSGGTAEYFRVDGSSLKTIFSKEVLLNDGVFLKLGGSGDLQIYHDGSNSYIKDTGTGNLRIAGTQVDILNPDSNEFKARFLTDGAVELYYDNSKKFETTNTGVKVTGVSEFADNTAAIAGGLTTGDVYRTGDLLKIVH